MTTPSTGTSTSVVEPPEGGSGHLPATWSARRIRTAAEARQSPDLVAVRDLPDDTVACRVCGVATDAARSTSPIDTVEVARPPARWPNGRVVHPDRPPPHPAQVRLGRCDVCAKRAAMADRLDTTIGVLVAALLVGLDLPGGLPRATSVARSAAAVRLTYDTWLTLAPGDQPNPGLGHVARTPFSHLASTDVAALRRASARYSSKRVAAVTVTHALADDPGVLDVAPPPLTGPDAPAPLARHEDPRLAVDGACLICGRPTTVASRAEAVAAMVDNHRPTDLAAALPTLAADAWTRVSLSPRNLRCRTPRGTTHRTRLAGWLCPRCEAVRAPDEPWTSRTSGRALGAYLRVPGAGTSGGPMLDPPTFASVVIDSRADHAPTEPTPTGAWDHVDLDDVRARLRDAGSLPRDPATSGASTSPTRARTRSTGAPAPMPTPDDW